MSTTSAVTAYVNARAAAYRAQADAFAAEAAADELNPWLPNPRRLAHLRAMQADYLAMADDLLAQLPTIAQEGNQ